MASDEEAELDLARARDRDDTERTLLLHATVAAAAVVFSYYALQEHDTRETRETLRNPELELARARDRDEADNTRRRQTIAVAMAAACYVCVCAIEEAERQEKRERKRLHRITHHVPNKRCRRNDAPMPMEASARQFFDRNSSAAMMLSGSISSG